MWLTWNQLPKNMQTEAVRPYYDVLNAHRGSLLVKRVFDFSLALLLLVLLSPVWLVCALWVKLDSKGPVFFRQERVTTYGKVFKIHKFRTMVTGADKQGSEITVNNDSRVTRSGAFLRKYKLDEIPQLLDILAGNMSFVGTRPEVLKYVQKYTPVMRATLLLPAGITSQASIEYKDESALIENAADVDHVYLTQVLPQKMKFNLDSIQHFSLWSDVNTMFQTVVAVL
ncbi:MAG: sugar transferase [Elusimicrobiaceae bacterium]|nr:sugar transferase [Elusimicrobiaceae bacterium]